MKYHLLLLLLTGMSILSATEITLTEAQFIREKNTTHSVKDGVFSLTMNGPSVYTPISFRMNVPADPELVCKFQYKLDYNGSAVDYVGVTFYQGKQASFTRVPRSDVWKNAVIPLKNLKLVPGTPLTKFTAFARVGNSGQPTVMIRNLRFVSGEAATAEDPLPEEKKTKTSSGTTVKTSQFMPDKGTVYSVKEGVVSVTMKAPAVYTPVNFNLNMTATPSLVCKFEYRVIANGSSVNYVGVTFYRDRKSYYTAIPAAAEWTAGKVSFGNLKIPAGEKLTKLNFFAKVDQKGTPTLEIRNIRFDVDKAYDPLQNVRRSYSGYPMFDWAPVKDAVSYRVQYRGETAETADYFYVPPAPLAPGLVEYTVTALPSGKTVVQDRLIVPEHNIRWRMPEFDFKTFAGQPHPRFKALAVQQVGDRAEKLLALARKNALVPVPDPPKPYVPGADPNVRSQIEWFGKICGGITAGTGERMTVLGQMAVFTGDAELIRAAREQALKVSTWDPDGTTHMRHADLYAARLLRGLIWCYDAAYNIMSPDERTQIVTAIEARGNQFFHNIRPFKLNEAQNHSWDRVEIAMFTALALAEKEGMEQRFRFGASVYAYRIFPSLGYDGENNEGLMYWAYGLGMALRFVDVAKHTVGLDLYGQPWLQQTSQFPMYINPPQAYSVSFADTGCPNHTSIGPMSRHFTAKLAAAGQDPYALWYCGYPEKDGIAAKIPLAIPQSRLYGHIGWTLLNTFLPDGREGVTVGFHSGKYFAGHQHADQNSFVINAYGDKLAIDGGYYDWWGSRHFRGYSARTEAHNTILVNGKGQDWLKEGSDGITQHYFDAPNFGFVSGDAGKVYQENLHRFDRDILFVKPGLIFVYDRLAAPEPAVFSWLLHSHSEENIALQDQHFAFSRPRAGLSGSLLLPRNAEVKSGKAYTIMPVKGYSETPVDNPQKEWCLTASNKIAAKEMEFLAAMRIRKGPGAVPEAGWQLEESADALLVKGNNTEVLFNRKPGTLVKLGSFTTDARCAAVILRNGVPQDVVKIGGRTLTYNDITCNVPGDWAKIAERPLVSKETRITLAGTPVRVKQHELSFAAGEKIYTVEGSFAIPESGKYQMTCQTAGHYIVSQGKSMRVAGEFRRGEAISLDLEKGPAILCVTSHEPIGAISLAR